MGDQFIETEFDPFFLGLTVINYKLKTRVSLSEKQKKWIENLKYIIPIFNRLVEHDKITIEDIVNGNTNADRKLSVVTNNDNKTDGKIPAIVNDNKTDSNEDKKESLPVDEEGDKMVHDMIRSSLNKLMYIRQNKWVKINDTTDIVQLKEFKIETKVDVKESNINQTDSSCIVVPLLSECVTDPDLPANNTNMQVNQLIQEYLC